VAARGRGADRRLSEDGTEVPGGEAPGFDRMTADSGAALASHWNAGGGSAPSSGPRPGCSSALSSWAAEHCATAAILLGCGIAANLVGCVLCARRRRLDPYRALQALVLVVTLFAFVAVRWLDLRGEFALLDPRVSARTMYVILVSLTVMLVGIFEFKGRAARKAAA
jgi:hypothetical protein